MYTEGGGFKYSSRTLMKVFDDYFGYKLVLLSSPGLESILVFKKYCHFALQSGHDGDDKNLRIVAATIKAETSATDKNQYKVQLTR